jgi:tetratricopeptide (TPR) repeat protein
MDLMKKLFIFTIIVCSAFIAQAQSTRELYRSGYRLLQEGKLPEAQSVYLQLYEKDSTQINTLFSLASIEKNRGYRHKAKAYYHKIIALDSNNFNAYKQLATLADEVNITEKLKYLQKANSLNHIDATIVNELCQIYIQENNFKQANEVLAPALAADTGNINLLKLKMPIIMAEKKYNHAIKIGESILNSGDSSTVVITHLANSYLSKLDYRNALRYFIKIKETPDDKEDLLYNIAICYRGIRDHKNATTYLNQAIEKGISPKTASYYGLLGESLENSNKIEDAINAYKRGLLFENNGSLYYNIALAYETKLNDKKNAIANYNLYLANYKGIKRNPRLASYIKNKIEELKR